MSACPRLQSKAGSLYEEWAFFQKIRNHYFCLLLWLTKIWGNWGIFESRHKFTLRGLGNTTHKKHPLTQFPAWEMHWGMGNFKGDSSAGRRRADRLPDPIFTRAALFAAQTEQTETDRTRKITTTYECSKYAKKDSLS